LHQFLKECGLKKSGKVTVVEKNICKQYITPLSNDYFLFIPFLMNKNTHWMFLKVALCTDEQTFCDDGKYGFALKISKICSA
jgi:hypothetical protein